MPDIDRPRKPPSWFWLFAPFVAAILIVLAWSAAWAGFRGVVASRIDATADHLRGEGWTVDWKKRSIGGYPFRIEVTLDQADIAEPSGWGLAAPRMEVIANAYDLGHWVAAAPAGVTLTRPERGAVGVTGQFLRASVVTAGGSPPRILIEGARLVVTPFRGGKPLPIAAADHLQLGLRPAPGDRGQVYVQIDGATAQPGGVLALMAGGRPLTIGARTWLTKLSALGGRDWPTAVRAWSAAGGAISLDQGEITAGPVGAAAKQASIRVGADGRLAGDLPLELRGGAQVVRALGQAHAIDPTAADTAASVIDARAGPAAVAKVDLSFLAGVTTLGPVAVAPAPKAY